MEVLANLIYVLASIFLLSFSNASLSSLIGVNYGRLGDNLPSPYQSIQLLQSMKAGSVKLYDANPEILRLLSWTKLRVSIMVRNDEIIHIASNQSLADQWVQEHVVPFYPDTRIRFVLVGNEVLSYNDRQLWYNLVPAMTRIHNSLRSLKIQNIKVGTPLAMDIMNSTFPPSIGQFRPEILDHQVIPSLLEFLNATNSYFFIDVYTYFAWSANPTNISLDFALLRNGSSTERDPGTGLVYTNLLDQMLDSIVSAMQKLGFDGIRVAIAETGWPNSGDMDQPGANVYNAAIYNRNVARKIRAKPLIGTPARPNVAIPTFMFALYDENQKDGPGTERHWGLLRPDGRPVYELDLTGRRPDESYGTLSRPSNNTPYKGKIWCVVANNVNRSELRRTVDLVCRQDSGICDDLASGGACNRPPSLTAHANYVFSSYWAKYRSRGTNCYFRGLAKQTINDPSHGSCKLPSVTL